MSVAGVPRFLGRILALGEAGRQERSGWQDGFMFNPALLRSGSQTVVTNETLSAIPAYGLAARIAAEAVAGLRMCVWRGDGYDAERVTNVWQARLLRGELNPEQSRFEFWETVEESLTYRANSYIWKVADGPRVLELWALHPDQCWPEVRRDGGRRRVIYRVHLGGEFIDPLGGGEVNVTVGPETILHVKGPGGGGRLVAPTPVQRFRATLGANAAKIDHERRTFEEGTAIEAVIEFPADMKPEQARTFRDLWRETYRPGSGNDTAVLGGGGAYKPIGLTLEDAQFIEAMNFSVEEVARMTNVQASLLGVMKASRPLTPEHEEDRWHRYGLGPRLERIESALLRDPMLFGPGSRVYPMFDLGEGVRGDLVTQETLDHQQVQDGRLLVDEWRRRQGLPPLPDGLGKVPQVVPVGGGANPASTPAVGAPVDAGDDDQED